MGANNSEEAGVVDFITLGEFESIVGAGREGRRQSKDAGGATHAG